MPGWSLHQHCIAQPVDVLNHVEIRSGACGLYDIHGWKVAHITGCTFLCIAFVALVRLWGWLCPSVLLPLVCTPKPYTQSYENKPKQQNLHACDVKASVLQFRCGLHVEVITQVSLNATNHVLANPHVTVEASRQVEL